MDVLFLRAFCLSALRWAAAGLMDFSRSLAMVLVADSGPIKCRGLLHDTNSGEWLYWPMEPEEFELLSPHGISLHERQEMRR